MGDWGRAQGRQGRPGRLRLAGSLLLLAAPPLATAGFSIESHRADLERSLTQLAVQAVFAGTLLHLVASRRDARRAAG